MDRLINLIRRKISVYRNQSAIIKINSEIDLWEWQQLELKLYKALGDDKVFVDPNLSHEDLSKYLGIDQKQFKQLVHQYLNIDLNKLIDRYRIEEVLRKVAETDFSDTAILRVAISCGYTSQGTFHRSFKLHTGDTPAVYFKEEREKIQAFKLPTYLDRSEYLR